MFPVWIHHLLQEGVILSIFHWSHFSRYGTVSGPGPWEAGIGWAWGSEKKDEYWTPAMSQALGFMLYICYLIWRHKRMLFHLLVFNKNFFKLLQVIIRQRGKVRIFFAFKMFRPSEGTIKKTDECSWLARGSSSTGRSPRSSSSPQPEVEGREQQGTLAFSEEGILGQPGRQTDSMRKGQEP